MILTLKRSKIHNLILILLSLLPLQVTLRLFLHLPLFLLFIYPFLVITSIYIIFIQNKKMPYNKFYRIIATILGIFYLEIILSVIINYPNVIDLNVPFEYYVVKYSPFWDSPLMSSMFAGVIRPFVYFTFCLLTFFIIKNEDDIRKIAKYLIIIGTISSLYSIYQYFAYKFGLPFGSIFSGHLKDGTTPVAITSAIFGRRCEGIFYEPGVHASFLSVVYLIILFNLKHSNNLLKLIFIVMTATLYLTWSPIGMLIVPISILFYILIRWKSFKIKQKLKIYMTFCIMIIFAIFIYFNIYNIENQIYTYLKSRIAALNPINAEEAYGGDYRANRIIIGWRIFKNHKWLGVGAGNDGFYYAQCGSFATGKKPDKGVVMNNNQKILVDFGIFGFFIYTILLLYPLYYYIKTELYKKQIDSFLSNYINAMFLAEFIMVVMVFQAQTVFFEPLFWIIYSTLCSAIWLKQKNIKELQYIQNYLINK